MKNVLPGGRRSSLYPRFTLNWRITIMADEGNFNSKVNGNLGMVTKGMNGGNSITLAVPGGVTVGVSGQYRIADGPWHEIPEFGLTVPLLPQQTMELKASYNGIDDTKCALTTNSNTQATFQFSWTDQPWPGVTVEAKESPIRDDEPEN
jgi:hypothetical protein